MKRCPTCQRTYTDPNLSFCVDDGSPLRLIDDVAEPQQDPWGAAPYTPPTTQVPAEPPKKKVWPWLLGGVAILILGGLTIGAVLIIPRFVRERQANRETENRPHNSNVNENQNDGGPNNTNEAVNTPAPTDKDLVLSQLTQLENEWEVANINADKKKLALILADDYVGPVGNPNGPVQGKDEYIKNIRRDSSTAKWEFKDLQLTLRGERATLVGKVDRTLVDGQVESLAFTDKFVWRNGRWQATGSVVIPVSQN